MSKASIQSDLDKIIDSVNTWTTHAWKNAGLIRIVSRLGSLTQNQRHLAAQTVIRMQRLLLVVLFLVFGVRTHYTARYYFGHCEKLFALSTVYTQDGLLSTPFRLVTITILERSHVIANRFRDLRRETIDIIIIVIRSNGQKYVEFVNISTVGEHGTLREWIL